MPEGSIDLSTLRHIRAATEVGSAANGQAIILELAMEDGASEQLVISPGRVGQIVGALLFAAGVAANDRLTAAGKAASADPSALIDIMRVNASSAPGADYVALRMVMGEGANLDFRIPLAVVPALQARIAESLALAQAKA